MQPGLCQMSSTVLREGETAQWEPHQEEEVQRRRAVDGCYTALLVAQPHTQVWHQVCQPCSTCLW